MMPSGVQLGPPVSYLALRDGTPVYDRRGRRVGVVDRLAADTTLDIFDGLTIHTVPLPGHHLFAGADQIAELHERGVVLSVETDALAPPRQERSGEDDGEASPEGRLHALLRRAWDRVGARS